MDDNIFEQISENVTSSANAHAPPLAIPNANPTQANYTPSIDEKLDKIIVLLEAQLNQADRIRDYLRTFFILTMIGIGAFVFLWVVSIIG